MSETILPTTVEIQHHKKPTHINYLSSIECTSLFGGEFDYRITLLNGRPDHGTDINIHILTTRENLKRMIAELSKALGDNEA